jgi:putative peptidoglycan lipid II flippase
LLERGAFSADSTSRTAQALAFYSPLLLGVSLTRVTTAAFFSMQDTRTPIRGSVWSLVINALLGIALLRPMGANGLALAAALGLVATASTLIWMLSQRLGGFPREGWGGLLLSMAAGCLALAVGVIGVRRWIVPHLVTGSHLGDRAIALALPAATALGLYASAGYLTRSVEFRYLARLVRGRASG